MFLFYCHTIPLVQLMTVCMFVIMLVDGNWSPWQPWGECSVSCGVGERTRLRSCNNPAPSNKGRPCPGDSTQLSRCNIQPCPGKKKTCLLSTFLFYKLKRGFRFFDVLKCACTHALDYGFMSHAALFAQAGRRRPEGTSLALLTMWSLA